MSWYLVQGRTHPWERIQSWLHEGLKVVNAWMNFRMSPVWKLFSIFDLIVTSALHHITKDGWKCPQNNVQDKPLHILVSQSSLYAIKCVSICKPHPEESSLHCCRHVWGMCNQTVVDCVSGTEEEHRPVLKKKPAKCLKGSCFIWKSGTGFKESISRFRNGLVLVCLIIQIKFVVI